MNTLPCARNSEIVVQELRGELLIYDLREDRAFCLNETLAIVYQNCDGTTSFDKLKKDYQFTDDLIHFALAELRNENLIDDETDDYFADLSRREIIKRVGLATLIALPVISGIVAPTAAMAASAAGACVGNGNGTPGTPIGCATSLAGCQSIAQAYCTTCNITVKNPSALCTDGPFTFECDCAA